MISYPSEHGLVIHVDGIIMDVNNETCAIFNITKEMIIGMNVTDIFHPSERDIIKTRTKFMLDTMKSGKKNLYLCTSKSGKHFYIEVKSKPIMWKGKKAILGIGKKIDAPIQMPMEFVGK